MKLQGYRETYYKYTRLASEVSRKLAFAGIAVVWIFVVVGDAGSRELPEPLRWPLLLFVLSLALDIIQYSLGSIIWYFFYRLLERKKTPEDLDLPLHSVWLDRPINLAWFGKVVALVVGYLFLLRFLWDQVKMV